MKAWIWFFALMGMLGCGLASASMDDGNTLLKQCKQFIKFMDGENANGLDAGLCGGFVRGVTSTNFLYSELFKQKFGICEPRNISANQDVRIVVKYLENNPKQLSEDRTILVWLALADAFPCK
ncbi:Rap1a/Tai family immunity protein [Pseudomonas sp. A-R-19]|uniref:Rap1a/Tai family immunity protein n=1 Tax=Pseudomonas sp. A-R-19 TaxID=2832403 RepID=UPI001CBA89E6|nr:Rap1a/Tai family immunity protein [Pseudomonas sp. A-R-19]